MLPEYNTHSGNALNKAGENEMAIRAFDRALEESKNQEGRHHILFRASILHDKALTLTDLNKDISAIRTPKRSPGTCRTLYC